MIERRHPHVLIAPASFKGSMSASDVADALAAGVRRAAAAIGLKLTCELVPLADGGEGTVDAVRRARGGAVHQARVHDPLGREIQAGFLLLDDGTAVIEMAAASGLPLLADHERDPLRASTRGTGELIAAAVATGARQLMIGVGGSATVDGGAGAVQALGVRLLDGANRPLPPGGAALRDLARIDVGGVSPAIRGLEIDVLCDVRNPLVGPDGASRVFGPQKGATPDDVETLDAALAHFAAVVERDLGIAVADLPGAGAAGGLAAGLVACLGARLRPGIDVIMELLDLSGRVQGADLVLTGEGRLDGQTVGGKVIAGLARVAAAGSVPLVAIAGSVAPEARALYDVGLSAAFALPDGPRSLDESRALGPDLLQRGAENVLRLWLAGTFMTARKSGGARLGGPVYRPDQSEAER